MNTQKKWNFLGYVERNEIYGLDALFSKSTYSGSLIFDWLNGNDFFQKQLNTGHTIFVNTGKNITLKEIEKYIKDF